MTNDNRIGSVSQRSGFGGVLLLVTLSLTSCAKSSSDDNAAALSSAREAQLRAESELKAMQARNAALLAAATAQKAAEQTPGAATPEPVAAPGTTSANPLPDVARIKGDLIGETVRGGVLTTYKFDSLDEIISLKQVNKVVAGNRAEFKLDAVLRKETGSTKRCFAVLNTVYVRTVEGGQWAFSAVRADTFTCE